MKHSSRIRTKRKRLPSAMIGSNDPYHSPINNAIDKFIKDKLPAITKGGYDIVDVRDVAKGILSIIEKGKPNNSYLLTGHYTSVKDLILLVSKITNKKPVRLLVPHFFIKIISPFIELYARIKRKTPLFTGFSMDCLMQNSNYNYKKASEDLYYNPRSL